MNAALTREVLGSGVGRDVGSTGTAEYCSLLTVVEDVAAWACDVVGDANSAVLEASTIRPSASADNVTP